MAKARVRSVLFTLLACGFGLSAISMVRADVTRSPNIYGFALHALTVSPSQDGGVLFTGNDVPVTDKNGNPVGSMDVAGFFGSPALPTGSFLSATMSLNDQQQRIDLAKMWFSTTLEVGIAASLTENQATLLNADLHIIGDTGVFVTYGEPSRPLSPPLSLSNAFRTNAPPPIAISAMPLFDTETHPTSGTSSPVSAWRSGWARISVSALPRPT